MADTLEIFGIEFPDATGIKATDDGGVVRAFVRPQGTLSISENGVVDVTQYASVDVDVAGGGSGSAVIVDTTDVAGGTIRTITTDEEVYLQASKTITPTTSSQTILPDTGYDGFESVIVEAIPGGGGDDFIVTLSYDSQSDMWLPDKTLVEIAAAYSAGKTIVSYAYDVNLGSAIGSACYYDNEDGVFWYEVNSGGNDGSANYAETFYYYLDGNGVTFDGTFKTYETDGATAVPADVANGKVFFNANGMQTGTASGGGGEDLLHATLNRTISGTVYDSTATGIPSYFFQSCYSLEGANFPAVRCISQYAFAYCYSLTTVSFPSVIDIMPGALYRCSELTVGSFSLATYIGSNAFLGCSNLSTIYFPSASVIGSMAFSSCSSLTIASFPVVSSIGQSAFYYCPNITTVSFPSATYIGGTAFAYCDGLTTVSFPKATSLGTQVFYGCYNLTTADFPVLTSIGNAMFQSCTNLTTVNFPIATSIGTSAFQSCTNLPTASFSSVTHIGGSAFQYCSSLTTVNFPTVTSINANAFAFCSSLSTVSFSTVTFISANAFRSCVALESVYILTSTVPTLNSTVFMLTPLSSSSYLGYYGSIFVKESLLASFQTATNWSAYSERMVGLTDAQIAALDGN